MKKYSMRLVFLFLFVPMFLWGQDSLETRDKLEIKFQAENRIRDLENLFNLLASPDLFKTEIEGLINDSYNPNSNQLFFKPNITVEDDINPNSVDKSTAIDVSVDRYLGDLNLFYEKSDGPSITFSNVKASKVYQGSYTYIRVFFESQFLNSHKEIPQPYQKTKRIADIRADKVGRKWQTRVVSITFYDPATPIEEATYKNEDINDLAKIAGQDNIDMAGRIMSPEQEQELTRKLLKMIEDQNKKREDEERARVEAFTKDLIAEGDRYFKLKDYESALFNYQEAKKASRYHAEALTKFFRAKREVELQKQAQQKQAVDFKDYIKDAQYAYHLRDYDKSVSLYEKALALNPRADSLRDRVRVIKQKTVALYTLDSDFRSGDFNSGIKAYSKKIKETPNNPDLYLGRGKYYERMEKEKQAISDYSEAIRLHKDFRQAYVARGRVHDKNGDPALAIQDYGMALTLDDKDIPLYEERSRLKNKTGDLPGAINDYTEALKREPQNGMLFLRRGQLFKAQNNTNRAIGDFTSAVEYAPLVAETWYHRGLIFVSEGRIDEASKDFAEARRLDLNPTSTQAVINLAAGFYNQGKMHFDNQKYDEAIAAFTFAVKIQPDYEEAWYMRGMTHQQVMDLFSADDDYSEAVRQNPDFYMAWYQRGIVRSTQGDFAAAIKDFGITTKLQPTYFHGFVRSGETFTEMGAYESAIEAYNKALSIDSELAEVHLKTGKVRALIGEHNKAIYNFDKAIKHQDDYYEGYYHRGLSFHQIKEYKKAVSDYSQAVKIKKDYAEAFYARGDAFDKLNDPKKAALDYSAAIQYQISNTDAHFKRGHMNKKLKQFKAAFEDFKMAESNDSGLISPQLYADMGEMCYKMGATGESEIYFKKSLDLNPNMHEAQYGLACYYLSQNKPEDAVVWLEKAFSSGEYSQVQVKKDKRLKPLKKNAEFKSLYNGLK